MPLSTDITLPKSVKPVFPDRCIVCHAKPDSTAKIAQNSQNPILAFLLPILLLFGWSRVEVPICRACKIRFRLQRWGREIVCWILVIALIWLLMPYFKEWSGLTRNLAVVGLVLLVLAPYSFAEVLWPRIFDTTARGDTVDYEFASPVYAAAFEAENSGGDQYVATGQSATETVNEELSASEVEMLKSRFRDAGCTVADLGGASFEIVGSEFPVRTHVFVNPYYIQLGTFIFASPRGFRRGRKSKIHEYLSGINRTAKLVKFTLESDKVDAGRGGWPIMASVKLVTGVAGGDYDASALKNLVMLWFQDIAELIASPGSFELHAMMQEEGADDAS